MLRARDPSRNKAFQVYTDAGGKVDLVEIASQLGVSAGTARGWKPKGKRERQLNGTLQTKVTERSKRFRSGQPGNQPQRQEPRRQIPDRKRKSRKGKPPPGQVKRRIGSGITGQAL